MPKNKSAVIRYKIINQMLVNSNSVTKKMIAGRCSEKLGVPVSLRTIENDLYAMRYSEGLGYFAPIEYDYQRQGYVYTDPDYSIDKIPVNDADLSKLRFAASLLNQYTKVNTFQEFSGVIDKVVRLINYHKLQSDKKGFDFIEFEKNPTTTGMDLIDQLIPVIQQKKVIKIKHHSFWLDKVSEFTVHPFYLKEYKFRWYLVGYCEERDDLRIFGLERIVEVETSPSKPFTHKLFNPELYFEKFIGVNVPVSKPEKIVLRFKNNVGKYMLTQAIHHSQVLIQEGLDFLDFEYLIAVNQEFVGIILSWGEHVEVLEPSSLRAKIHDIHSQCLESYQKNPG